MKKIPLGIIFLTIAVIIFFYQLFLGKYPIPSDTITGLYHPFRDFYAAEYPNGMPYKNFLITDPVRQQYPWRELAIESFKKVELPLWNPYNLTGTPLLANFQTGAFYPLNILLFILPFPLAWSLLILLQPLFGGVFLYLFLRNKKIDPRASLISGITFAFSGFSISWMEWNTVVQVTIWLPLILLAKDKLLEKLTFKWAAVLIFAECCAILAGHLQILFYLWTVTTSYLVLRIFQISWTKNSYLSTLKKACKTTLPFLPMVALILLVTAIQWVPTFDFIKESAREIDQINWQKEGWFIPWQHLLQFIVPDFFGNPTTLNYWGTWNYGELTGYVGLAPLILALFAIFFRRDRMVLYFGAILFISLVFALPTFFAKLPYQLNIPFLATSQPTRLLFLTDFALAVLAGLGAESLLKKKRGIFLPLLIVGLVLGTSWIAILGKFEISERFTENFAVVKSNLLLPSLTFVLIALIFSLAWFFKKHLTPKIVIGALIVVTLFDLFRFGWKFLPFTSGEYLYPKTRTTEFLQNQNGIYRIMATDSRILPPNFSILYRLQTVDGYDPLYIRRYGELIAMIESGKGRVPGVLAFNRIITPHNYNSKLIDLLNVKYLLSFEDLSDARFKKVFQEEKTIVYENTNVLPRAFFVSQVIPVQSKEDATRNLFGSTFDPASTAIVENAGGILQSYSVGKAEIISYESNKVTIKVENNNTGFLQLTDAYYPTWSVALKGRDGKITPGKIYRTNYNFRGVVIPKETEEVVFTNNLF
jgi:hypothetical protein